MIRNPRWAYANGRFSLNNTSELVQGTFKHLWDGFHIELGYMHPIRPFVAGRIILISSHSKQQVKSTVNEITAEFLVPLENDEEKSSCPEISETLLKRPS